MKATELVTQLGKMNDGPREALVKTFLLSGYVPSFLWNFKPITVTTPTHTLMYKVMPDYLCIGEDTDYLRMPMIPPTVTPFMDAHGLMLPTKKMVDQIYHAAPVKILPVTWDNIYGKSQTKFNRDSTRCYVDMNAKIQQRLTGWNQPLGTLVSGHKKDVVLTNELNHHKGNVAIYGWFNADGSVIQGLQAIAHSVTYVDYSHGLRMVSKTCVLDGHETTLEAIAKDPALCHLINDEPLSFLRY